LSDLKKNKIWHGEGVPGPHPGANTVLALEMWAYIYYIFIMKSYTRYTIKRKWKKDKEKIKTQN